MLVDGTGATLSNRNRTTPHYPARGGPWSVVVGRGSRPGASFKLSALQCSQAHVAFQRDRTESQFIFWSGLDGEEAFTVACELGLEGIVSKRLTAPSIRH